MIISEIPYTEEYIEAPYTHAKYGHIQLGALKCYNINIQVKVEKSDRHTKGMTTLTLREVPKFLIDAFNIIRSNIEKEGLFRKSGSNARINSYQKKLWAIYMGIDAIPEDFNYLDICTLIKSFIKALKTPLLNADLANKLLDLARRKDSGKAIIGEDVQELFRPRNLMHKEVMSKAHIGTLGFLMRELYRISQHSDKNGMTMQNLATCFGPTLFDITPTTKERGTSRKSMGSLHVPSMEQARQTTQRAATAIAILIERATWIGLHRECYVASQARSSSAAAPLQRTPRSQNHAMSKRSAQQNAQLDYGLTRHSQENLLAGDAEGIDRGFGSAVKHCARRSLDFLATMSPLPGRKTFRSFLGRQKSSDTLTSDEDRLATERMSSSEEALDDLDRKPRRFLEFPPTGEQDGQLVDGTFDTFVEGKSSRFSPQKSISNAVPILPKSFPINTYMDDFDRRPKRYLEFPQTTGQELQFPRAAGQELHFPKATGQELQFPRAAGQELHFPKATGQELQSMIKQEELCTHNPPETVSQKPLLGPKAEIKPTVPQLNFDLLKDPLGFPPLQRRPAFVPYSRDYTRRAASFTDLCQETLELSSESPPLITTLERLTLDPNKVELNEQTAPILPTTPSPKTSTPKKKAEISPLPIIKPTTPQSRKRISGGVYDRRHFISPIKTFARTRPSEDFGQSDHYRNAIAAASSASDLDGAEGFDLRPSVAFISQNRRGLVRDRVNQFGGGGNLSTVASSGRPSTISDGSKPSESSIYQFNSPTFL